MNPSMRRKPTRDANVQISSELGRRMLDEVPRAEQNRNAIISWLSDNLKKAGEARLITSNNEFLVWEVKSRPRATVETAQLRSKVTDAINKTERDLKGYRLNYQLKELDPERASSLDPIMVAKIKLTVQL